MIDFTVLANVLEKDILPVVKNQMYQKAPMWQLWGGWKAADNQYVPTRANVGVDKFQNNTMYMPLRSAYNSGIVNIAVGEKYQYGSPQYLQASNSITTLVGSFQIPKAVLNVTDKGAVIRPLAGSTKSLADDLAMDANRQCYGEGDGVIATTASSGTGATTVPLTASVNGDIDYARYFPPGTAIKIGSNTAPFPKVVAQTGADTITIDTATTFSASDNISKVNGSNVVSEEFAGLKAIVDNDSFEGIDPATYYIWAAQLDNVNGTLTNATIVSRMNKTFHKAQKNGNVRWIVMNSSMFQTYGNGLTGQIRFDKKEVLSGGWMGLDYMAGNAQILLDYDCTDDRIYFLTLEALIYGMYQNLEWEKGNDGILFKIAQQLDYEVTASWMGQLGTNLRNANGVAYGITAGF